ncbi:MAG TPA: glycosyltransferase, partial [Myxococcota bacterium]|nr:glycosyltransferase [Myxococcota bacterium]
LRSKLGAIRGVSEELFGPADLRAWLQRLGREPGHYDFAEFAYPSAGPTVRDARWVAKRTGFCLVECVTRSKAMDLLRMVEAGRLDGLGECVAQLLEVCHLETAGMADADRVFAVTAKDQQFADTLGAHGRSHVIPTGLSEFAVLRNVKPAATRVGPAALDPLVAFIGYFDHTPNREGMEWYLEYVHPRVRAAVPDYRVRIIGRGNIAFLDKFRAEDASIHATGEVDDIVRPLRDVRVCISPLISGAGIRGKINQYAAAGRPTVTTSIGVCGTPYEHDVSVLVADAPDTFADAIVSLLRDDARWLKLREGAGKVVRAHFMWPAITQRVESLYAR